MPKDLATQLAELEDAERRLRPLITDARGVIQDLKSTMQEARELFRLGADEALKGEMGKLIEREMRDVVPDVARFKKRLEKDLNDKTGEVLTLLDQVLERYGAVSAQYDRIEEELTRRGYKSESHDERIVLPVPHRRRRT
jgi:predicted  nucleic acid-binding Zn-ribbon protein